MRLYGYYLAVYGATMLAPMALLMGNYLLLGIAIVSSIAATIKIFLYDPMDDIE